MTSLITKAGKKYASKHSQQYAPEDPFYEFYDAGNGTQKRRKRAPPPGLTKKEAALLKKIARRAHYLDKGFYICGFRFGWTAMIGIIPGVGDVASAMLNYTLVYKPSKKGADLPPDVCQKMIFNNAVSAGIGIVPFVGDIALAVWKANSRNAHLLEKYLRQLGQEHIAAGMTGLTPDTAASTRPSQTAAAATSNVNQAGGASNAASTSEQPKLVDQTTGSKKKLWGRK